MFTPKRKASFLYRIICSIVVFAFTFTTITPSYAQSINLLNLPVPGTMVHLSQPFVPVLLKGMTIHPNDPLRFDFIVDSGNTDFTQDQIKQESERLIKYFLASMTIPKDDLWVNLSPHEKDRIIPEELGKTELGRDMLAQDYILKQLTASLMYPEEELGKKFWSRVRTQAKEKFGTNDIPRNTFNKVWIMPESATVYEHEQTVYIVESKFKVMLDSDYMASKMANDNSPDIEESVSPEAKSIIQEIIIPEIAKEVNEGKNFAPLRQIYHSLILAKWYKETVKNSLLSQVYINQKKTAGIDVNDPTIKDQIYNRYMQAYKKGVYNYIKEDYDELSQKPIPRKYFSGGELLGVIPFKREQGGQNFDAAVVGDSYQLAMRVDPQREDGDSAMVNDPKKDYKGLNRRNLLVGTAVGAAGAALVGTRVALNLFGNNEENQEIRYRVRAAYSERYQTTHQPWFGNLQWLITRGDSVIPIVIDELNSVLKKYELGEGRYYDEQDIETQIHEFWRRTTDQSGRGRHDFSARLFVKRGGPWIELEIDGKRTEEIGVWTVISVSFDILVDIATKKAEIEFDKFARKIEEGKNKYPLYAEFAPRITSYRARMEDPQKRTELKVKDLITDLKKRLKFRSNKSIVDELVEIGEPAVPLLNNVYSYGTFIPFRKSDNEFYNEDYQNDIALALGRIGSRSSVLDLVNDGVYHFSGNKKRSEYALQALKMMSETAILELEEVLRRGKFPEYERAIRLIKGEISLSDVNKDGAMLGVSSVSLIGALQDGATSVRDGEIIDISFTDIANRIIEVAMNHGGTIAAAVATVAGAAGGLYYYWSRHTVSGNIFRLKHGEYETVSQSIKSLFQTGDPRAIQHILGAVDKIPDFYGDIIDNLTDNLRSLGATDTEIFEGYLKALWSENFHSDTAAILLGKFGNTEAVDLLLGYLSITGTSNAENALKRLGATKDQIVGAYVDFVIKNMDKTENNFRLFNAAERLGILKDKKALPVLRELLEKTPDTITVPNAVPSYGTAEVFDYVGPNADYDTVKKAIATIESTADEAQLSDVGGVDMNKIEVDRQGAGVNIQFDPVQMQKIMNMDINGFAPVIINLTPLPSIMPLLGLEPRNKEDDIEISSVIQ